MKIRISKNKIRNEIRKVVPAVDKKGNVPILQNILIDANNDVLNLLATDTELGISTKTDADIVEKGETTVNAQKFFKLLSSIVDDEIEVETQKNILTVKATNSHFQLATLPADEFPSVTLPSFENGFSIPSLELDKAIRKVSYATSRDEVRYILTGIFIKSTGNRLDVVATDAHRMAIYEVLISVPKFSAILPKRSMVELKKLLRDSNNVNVYIDKNILYFGLDNTVLWTTEIDGEYPDYSGVIPTSNPLVCTIGREDFLNALKEVSVIYDSDVKPVIFKLTPSTLTLSARKSNLEGVNENAEVKVPIEYSGENFEIGFNASHLIESAMSFDAESLEIFMDKPTSPVLITSEKEKNLKDILMPMKVD